MPTEPASSAPPHKGSLGVDRPVIRPSHARALAGLTVSIVLRLLREGLVVRALAWPGMLTALSMFVSASATIAWRNSPIIYLSPAVMSPAVDASARPAAGQAQGDSALVASLKAAKFVPVVDENPEAVLVEGRGERAVWKEGDRYVFAATWGGTLTTKAEAALRDALGEPWRIQMPPPAKRRRDSSEMKAVTGALAGIVGLLFTLYGVVIGAGSLYRDRSSGVLESDLALAIPRWIHAIARLTALSTVLAPALVVSLWVVDALMPLHSLTRWTWADLFATLAGGALGFHLMARASSGKGFSGPLSQAITASMGLISVGYMKPDIGHHLPLLSLGALFAQQDPSWVVIPVSLVASALVAADFHRRECV